MHWMNEHLTNVQKLEIVEYALIEELLELEEDEKQINNPLGIQIKVENYEKFLN